MQTKNAWNLIGNSGFTLFLDCLDKNKTVLLFYSVVKAFYILYQIINQENINRLCD